MGGESGVYPCDQLPTRGSTQSILSRIDGRGTNARTRGAREAPGPPTTTPRSLDRDAPGDPGTGVMRHADAGYEEAIQFARANGVDLPSLPR